MAPALSAVSCGCTRCSVLANFLSMSTCASVTRKAISVQTREVSWGTGYIEASPGAAKSGTVFLFPLDFLLWMDFEDKSCKSALFLSCLVYKDLCCVRESGLCRIHSSEGNLAHILQYHARSAVDSAVRKWKSLSVPSRSLSIHLLPIIVCLS